MEYYNIKPKDKDVNGIVIRVNSGKLEVLAGEEDSLKKYNVNIDNDRISIEDNYIAISISEKDAERLRDDYFNWMFTQGYVAGDAWPPIKSGLEL